MFQDFVNFVAPIPEGTGISIEVKNENDVVTIINRDNGSVICSGTEKEVNEDLNRIKWFLSMFDLEISKQHRGAIAIIGHGPMPAALEAILRRGH